MDRYAHLGSHANVGRVHFDLEAIARIAELVAHLRRTEKAAKIVRNALYIAPHTCLKRIDLCLNCPHVLVAELRRRLVFQWL